jgi:murein DD-endopeptidase MepM/ murein hydrolase activator NlpD
MQTASVLVRAWLVAAGLVVILCLMTSDVRGIVATAPQIRLTDPQAYVASGADLLIPVVGVSRAALRDTFGQARSGMRMHGAIDILAPRGTPVVASVDGAVRKLFTSAAGGLTIYEFDVPQQKVYYYAHLDRYAAGLHEGELLHRGDIIGYVGTTGNAPPGTPHLHFAIGALPPSKEWWKSVPENPYPLLASRGVTVTTPVSALR